MMTAMLPILAPALPKIWRSAEAMGVVVAAALGSTPMTADCTKTYTSVTVAIAVMRAKAVSPFGLRVSLAAITADSNPPYAKTSNKMASGQFELDTTRVAM